jgi:hypothetical protein
MPTGDCSTARKRRQHERPSVPMAALRQALRRTAAMVAEARATTGGVTSHLNLCRWLSGARVANTRRAP